MFTDNVSISVDLFNFCFIRQILLRFFIENYNRIEHSITVQILLKFLLEIKKMISSRQLIFLAGILALFIRCNEDFENQDKYRRPDWLAGKLYTQIIDQPELSVFARCLELTGYDTIINTSGSYTVFAPDDEAFASYFQSNPDYSSIDDIPTDDLVRIVKYHIVQNPWSKEQLKSLDIYGWVDSLDINNDEPRGYKRETLLREKDQKYGVKMIESNTVTIVDTLQTQWYRRQYTDSRKYAPLFFKEYFDIYDLNSDDYEFYFDRPFGNSSDMYYMGGRIVKADIFAENGFIQIIDKVIEPLQNAYQILNTVKENHSYKKFLDLVNTFPVFTYNTDKTFDQPGADLGYEVDSLFDISYSELTFDISNERTKAPSGSIGLPGNVTIRYHNGLIAPTDEALDEFENEYLVGGYQWGSLKNAPHHIKRMIANTYMSANPIYPTDMKNGFYNGEMDIVHLDMATVVQQEYGSNCTFIGVNKAIVPRAFKSVTGPVYLNKGYSITMYAIERAGLLPTLKKENNHFLFYVESDQNCRDDSSLLYSSVNEIGTFTAFQISGQSATRFTLSTNDLRILLLNHVGTGYPNGIARKEFIPNLAGNFLIINNETGEVRGTAPTTIGFKGSEQTTVIPTQISTGTDNGATYDIKNWFDFSIASLYIKISTSYPAFHNLIKAAGLSMDKEYRYTFISDNENYTIFVPNDSALAHYRTDTLTTEELKNFVRLHFIQGDIIFTDGNKPAKYYETTRIDEKSTIYTTIYNKIYINPGYDVIHITDKVGGDYLNINESPLTNQITGRSVGDGTEAFANILSTAVIHEIDKVLIFEDLDTQ